MSGLLSRPTGLWKHAKDISSALYPRSDEWHSPHQSSFECDTNDIEHAASPSSTLSLKHFEDVLDDTHESSEEYYFADFSGKKSPFHTSSKTWTTRKKIITSSTATMAARPTAGSSDAPGRDDWEDLKDLFARATEQYEYDDPAEALPTLRGVIHECHRFNRSCPDPTVVFLPQIGSGDQGENVEPPMKAARSKLLQGRRWKPDDLPTSFHTIEGSALFLMGNLIAQNPSLALNGEPDNGVFYWTYALDVFETGQTLQARFCKQTGIDVPEDWRMALMWGRTYVAIAEETIAREARSKSSGEPFLPPLAQFSPREPTWPPESPFHTIVQRRAAVTHRMSLKEASAHELMVLAMDQFSRGIFHMPHPDRAQKYHAISSSPSGCGGGGVSGPWAPIGSSASGLFDASESAPPGSTSTPPSPPSARQQEIFSRAKELFTIAADILSVADDLGETSERQQWASWAQSIFEQMKLEVDSDAWRRPLTRARARCFLISGSAGAVLLEPALERGDASVLDSEDADEARESLEKAVELIEQYIGSSSAGGAGQMEEEERQEMSKWLLEALVTLANLTKDEAEREKLYEKAKAEGEKQDYDLEMEDVDEDEDEDEQDHDGMETA